jgi:hypothetical protein
MFASAFRVVTPAHHTNDFIVSKVILPLALLYAYTNSSFQLGLVLAVNAEILVFAIVIINNNLKCYSVIILSQFSNRIKSQSSNAI